MNEEKAEGTSPTLASSLSARSRGGRPLLLPRGRGIIFICHERARTPQFHLYVPFLLRSSTYYCTVVVVPRTISLAYVAEMNEDVSWLARSFCRCCWLPFAFTRDHLRAVKWRSKSRKPPSSGRRRAGGETAMAWTEAVNLVEMGFGRWL